MGHSIMGRMHSHRPQTVNLSAIAASLLAASAIFVGLLSSPNAVTAADPPKPAKKDTPRALKPKTAVLTTSVEPAEAKPGERVTFKVTAKLEPGFHIYKY